MWSVQVGDSATSVDPITVSRARGTGIFTCAAGGQRLISICRSHDASHASRAWDVEESSRHVRGLCENRSVLTGVTSERLETSSEVYESIVLPRP